MARAAAAKRVPKFDARAKNPGSKPRVEFNLEHVEQVARLQCTYEEAAAFFKCTKMTVIRHMKDDVAFREAWERGQAGGKLSLRRTMYAQAQLMNGAGVNQAQHLSKHWLGMHDKVLNEHSGKDGKPIRYVIHTPPVARTSEEWQRLYSPNTPAPAGSPSTGPKATPRTDGK